MGDSVHWETPPEIVCNMKVVKSHADAICTWPRLSEVIQFEHDKRTVLRNRTKEQSIDYFPPVRSFKTSLIYFLHSQVS